MELAFAYKASIQPDSAYQKCCMEGKFRETRRKEDEFVLYEIYIPNALYVQNNLAMVEGKHLTITGTVDHANGAFSKVLVEELQTGWSSDTLDVFQDTLVNKDQTSPDSISTGVNVINDSLRSKLDSLMMRTAKDSASKKVRRDSSWIK